MIPAEPWRYGTTRVDEKTYVVGVWTCARPGVDVLATLYRDERITPGFVLDYRFRYDAEEGDPFSGVDEKHFYRWGIDKSEIEAIATVEGILGELANLGFGDRWHALIRGGVDAFRAAMATCPCAHYQAGS